MIDFGQNTITNRQAVLDLISSVDTSVEGLSTYVDIQGSFSVNSSVTTTSGDPVLLNPIPIKPDFVAGKVYAWIKDFDSGRCAYLEYGIVSALVGNTYSVQPSEQSLTGDYWSQFGALPAIEILGETEYPTIQIQFSIPEDPYPTLHWFVVTKLTYPS